MLALLIMLINYLLLRILQVSHMSNYKSCENIKKYSTYVYSFLFKRSAIATPKGRFYQRFNPLSRVANI